MNRIHFSLLAALVFSSLATAPCLAAGNPEATQAADVPRVVLVFDPTRERALAAVQAIESHLSGLRVSVDVVGISLAAGMNEWLDQASQQAASREALGSFAIDATPRGELLIFFTEVSGEATLLRRIRPKTAGGRVALEEAGIVVSSLVEALLDGRHIGMEPSAPSPTSDDHTLRDSERTPVGEVAPPPRASAPSQSVRHTAVSLGYLGTSFAQDTFQSGLVLGARTDLAERWSLLASYAILPELELDREGVHLSLQRHPLVLGLGYEAAGTLAPLVEVTGFSDWVTRRTPSTQATLAGTPDQNHWMWGIGSRIGAHWGPASRLHVHVTFGVDVPIGNLSFVVEGESPRTVIVPRSVRPQAEASLIANLW
ncbi:MAG TPA: hypothetical protein VFQ61_15065 [Polyangiaceae bacterium]|nr:hypothetical protein [Polyangiaceae bacterium]